MARRVFAESASARVVADRARLVGVCQVIGELAAQLGEVAEGNHLFAGLEEMLQLLFLIDDLAGAGGGQLEGARVHPDHVVHRVVRVERQGRAAVPLQQAR